MSNSVFGGINYPFDTTPVFSTSSNIHLKPLITASSNTVTIYNDLNGSSVFGAYFDISSYNRRHHA
jgi:hypothetical protein